MQADDRYIFIVQWFDTTASIVKKYHFTYFTIDNTIQMFDLKNKKLFLKRCEYQTVTLKDLFIGAVISVYSRQLKIIDYADQFTKKKLQSQRERTYAMIKPDSYLNIGKIISIIQSNKFKIGNVKMFKMSQRIAQDFYIQHRGKPFYQQLIQYMSSDLVIGLQLIFENSIEKWRQLIGPKDIKMAKLSNPNSIRALFGQSTLKNCCHGSDSASSAQRQLDFVFSSKSHLKSPAIFNSCTCCIIKPHIISEGRVGEIIDIILQKGFQISAMQMFWLDRPTSEEFFEVYKGVIPQYNSLCEDLTNGPCIAMQIRQEDAVKRLKQLCGPHDSQLARVCKPKSLRSIFGKDKIRNGVHCTDLQQDGLIQVEYFFNILQQK